MSEFALRVKDVSKKFKLYHEKRTSLYEVITSGVNRGRHYETIQTLDNVSFDLKKGEGLGIIGRNGSGKTTLLRIISNIYQPDSGSVEINGTIVPVLALGLGFHPEFTAIDNIYQSSVLLGISRKQISQRVDKIIEYAELEKFADTKFKNFSSGMQMRLAFSTAVQVDPDILLLDEVYAVGDLKFQKKCFDTILDFKKQGKSIILVSHGMDPIKKICDKALFLNQGKIDTIGTPDEAIAAYIDYLGKQNI